MYMQEELNPHFSQVFHTYIADQESEYLEEIRSNWNSLGTLK